MKDWTITESQPMYRDYDPVTLAGIGDLVGHHVSMRVFRGVRIDVWGHSEGEEETERIANMIASIPALNEQIVSLKEQVRKLKEELKDNGRDDINYELLNPEHDWK